MIIAPLCCNRSFNPSVIDQLNCDWVTNHRTHRYPPAWQHDPPLTGRTPAQLVDDARDQQHRNNTEQVLTALVRRAQTDDLAALTALHILLPATKALLASTHGQGELRDGDRSLAVIEDLWQIIRLYPCHRPGPVWANVTLDLRKAYLADRYGPVRNSRHQRRPVSVAATVRLDATDHEPLPMADAAATGTASPGAELIELLCQAVTAGHLDTTDAALIGRCRIADVTADELGAAQGLQPQSVRRQRQRAEQRLRQHVVAAAA